MSDAFHDSVMSEEEEIIENLRVFCEMMEIEYPSHNTFSKFTKLEELQKFSKDFKRKHLTSIC